MRLLTPWQTWWKPQRKEMAFHCDLILEPGDFIIIISSSAPQGRDVGYEKMEVIAPPPGKYSKVHLAASWEHRDSLFVEEKDADTFHDM